MMLYVFLYSGSLSMRIVFRLGVIMYMEWLFERELWGEDQLPVIEPVDIGRSRKPDHKTYSATLFLIYMQDVPLPSIGRDLFFS